MFEIQMTPADTSRLFWTKVRTQGEKTNRFWLDQYPAIGDSKVSSEGGIKGGIKDQIAPLMELNSMIAVL